MAALSRPVAGTIASRSSSMNSDQNPDRDASSVDESDHETLIITLPGSLKAVRESLSILLDNGAIVHAVELMKGGDGSGSGQGVHGALEPESPYGHGHGHRHHGGHRHDHDHGHGRGGRPFHSESPNHHHHHHGNHRILSHDPSEAGTPPSCHSFISNTYLEFDSSINTPSNITVPSSIIQRRARHHSSVR